VGEEVPIWFMTNKFSTQQYNIGNGTFSNIILSTEYETAAPTSASPTFIPTDIPSGVPSKEPSVIPTPQPLAAQFQQSTTLDMVVNKANTESGSVSPLTIAIIVIVVLFVVLCCHAIFLFGRYRKRREAIKDEDDLDGIVDDEGNVITDMAIHPPQEDPNEDSIVYEEEPLEQLSKPDDKQLILADDESGFKHERQDTQEMEHENVGVVEPATQKAPAPVIEEASSTKVDIEDASSTHLESEASSTEIQDSEMM